MHQLAFWSGEVGVSEVAQEYVGSGVTVKPALALIAPRVAALVPVFMVAIWWLQAP